VLTIDQCEEVLTLREGLDDNNRRAAFFFFLEELCLRNIETRLVAALRTEYYGQFCDDLRIEASSKVTARAGMEQFMLHGLTKIESVMAAIERPTLRQPLEPYGPPYDIYRFSYETGVARTIGRDLLDQSGDSSILPALQIVCKKPL
jgi:hypothetical protein